MKLADPIDYPLPALPAPAISDPVYPQLHQQLPPQSLQQVLFNPASSITLFPSGSSYNSPETSSPRQLTPAGGVANEGSAQLYEQPPQQQQHPAESKAKEADLTRRRKSETDEPDQRNRTESCPDSSVSSATSDQPVMPYKKRRKGKLLLWQFLLKDLLDGHSCVSWVENQAANPGVFKFRDANQAARRWGHYKENENMSYEKMSRCIRDYWIREENKYFRTMIGDPVKGRRLHFSFNLQNKEVQKFVKTHSEAYFHRLVAEGIVQECETAPVL